MTNKISDVLKEQCIKARTAWRELSCSNGEKRDNAVRAFAAELRKDENIKEILAFNDADVERARKNGVREGMIDRLTLTAKRIEAIASSLTKVAMLPDVLGCGEVWTRPNGLVIRRVHVPIGNIGIIYEARPNVTVDAAALCIKSGNTVILRGGSDALATNKAIVSVLRKGLISVGLSENSIQLITDTSHESANALMKLNGFVDLLIPRGSARLIRSVKENASVPYIETGAGNCHIYVHSDADPEMAVNITINAKTQRPSVCNAAEKLIVHKDIAPDFLPLLAARMAGVELRGDDRARAIVPMKTADKNDWETEYNDMTMAVRVVDSLEEAVCHINTYNTHHSEAIITRSLDAAEYFRQNIDAAAVYVNASTRFTDGEEFGFGAEIGISTQKLHARGPMGLKELTTVKYYIDGNGQIR